MSNEKKFVDGLIIKDPGNAPDYVKCKISIKRKDLGNWLRQQTDDWINLDVKVSQQGKWYAQVNDWKPNDAKKSTPKPAQSAPVDDFDDDIPF